MIIVTAAIEQADEHKNALAERAHTLQIAQSRSKGRVEENLPMPIFLETIRQAQILINLELENDNPE